MNKFSIVVNRIFFLYIVALLGTKFTMEKDFFKNILIDKGIDVIVPQKEDRDLVHDIIYNELVKGEIKLTSKKIYLRIIEDLIGQGAQGIILGCTEIPLLIAPNDTDIPLFNTTKKPPHKNNRDQKQAKKEPQNHVV